MGATYPSHLSVLDFYHLVILGEDYRLRNVLLRNFSHPPVIVSLSLV